MKQCTHCQFGNPEEARFCRHCGNPFQDMQPTAPQNVPEPVEHAAAAPAVADGNAENTAVSAASDETAGQTVAFDAVPGESEGNTDTASAPHDDASETVAVAEATDEAAAPAASAEDSDATVAIEQAAQEEGQPATSVMPQVAASAQETQPLPQQPNQPPIQSIQFTQPVPQPQAGQPYASQQFAAQQLQQPVQPQQPMGQPAAQGTQPQFQNGTPMQQPAYQQQFQGAPAPQQPSAFEAESRTFFNWLKEAFLHPSQDKPMKKWYSWVVTAFLTFMIAANITLWVAQGASFADSLIGSTRYYRSALPSVLVVMWIAMFLMLYAYILFALLGRRVLGDSKKFANFHDEYARRLMPWVVLELVVFVLSVIRLDILAVPLQMLGLGLFSMWQPVVVAQGNSTARRDPHWGWILAMIVQMLLTLLAIVVIVVVILGGFAASLGKMSYGMY